LENVTRELDGFDEADVELPFGKVACDLADLVARGLKLSVEELTDLEAVLEYGGGGDG
jgi:hypothetical protein